MNEIDEMSNLKQVGLSSGNDDVRKSVIDTLSEYGLKAIPSITEIVEYVGSNEVKQYGLEAIKKIKQKSDN